MSTARTEFLLGVLLAWGTARFFFALLLPQISRQATGLLFGGSSRTTLGLVATTAFEICAIVLLVHGSSGGPIRFFIAALSICCAGFTLLVCGLALWKMLRRPLR